MIPPLGSLAIHEGMCWHCFGTGTQHVPVMWVHNEGECGRPVHSQQCEVCQGSGEVFIIAKPKPLDVQGLVERMNELMRKHLPDPIDRPPAVPIQLYRPGDILNFIGPGDPPLGTTGP